MKNLLFFLPVLLTLLCAPCIGEDCSSFKSIEEIIAFETSLIENADQSEYEYLSEIYLSRAESYLLCMENELAFIDFQKGFEIAEFCEENIRKSLHFRALFGLAIVYGCSEMTSELSDTINALKTILSPYNENRESADQCLRTFVQARHTTCIEEPEITGPDHISIQDCIEFAEGTARKCRYLISLVPKAKIRLPLEILIDELEIAAVNCCVAGGVWKACLRPILNKWYLWNQKWNLLGIPPDPAWD